MRSASQSAATPLQSHGWKHPVPAVPPENPPGATHHASPISPPTLSRCAVPSGSPAIHTPEWTPQPPQTTPSTPARIAPQKNAGNAPQTGSNPRPAPATAASPPRSHSNGNINPPGTIPPPPASSNPGSSPQ